MGIDPENQEGQILPSSGIAKNPGDLGKFQQRLPFFRCSAWDLATKKSPDAAPVMDTAQGERGVLLVTVGRSSAGRPATDRAVDRIFSPCRPFVAQIDQVNSH